MGYCDKTFVNCLGDNRQRIKAVNQCENFIATSAVLFVTTRFKLKYL